MNDKDLWMILDFLVDQASSHMNTQSTRMGYHRDNHRLEAARQILQDLQNELESKDKRGGDEGEG